MIMMKKMIMLLLFMLLVLLGLLPSTQSFVLKSTLFPKFTTNANNNINNQHKYCHDLQRWDRCLPAQNRLSIWNGFRLDQPIILSPAKTRYFTPSNFMIGLFSWQLLPMSFRSQLLDVSRLQAAVNVCRDVMRNSIFAVSSFGKYINFLRRGGRGTTKKLLDWTSMTVRGVKECGKEYSLLTLEGDSIEVDVGQTVTLCFADNEDNIWQRPAFPIDGVSARGQFQVLVHTSDNAAESSHPAMDATRSIGRNSEVAIREGSSMLPVFIRSKSCEDLLDDLEKSDIDRIVLISSGLGATSAIQLLRTMIATGSQIPIELYIDSDVLSGIDELETLRTSLGQQLSLFPLPSIESDAANPNSSINKRNITSQPNVLAIIAGPARFVDRMSDVVKSRSRKIIAILPIKY